MLGFAGYKAVAEVFHDFISVLRERNRSGC